MTTDEHWGDRIICAEIKTARGDYTTTIDGVDFIGSVLSLAASQRADLALSLDHEQRLPIGAPRRFERQASGSVWMVGKVPAGGPADGLDLSRFRCSIEGWGDEHPRSVDPLLWVCDVSDWDLKGISLVSRPHMSGLGPVYVARGDFDSRSSKGGWPWSWSATAKAVTDRALDARPSRFRRRSTELMVVDAPGVTPRLDPIEEAAMAAFDELNAELVTDERGRMHHRRLNSGYIDSIT